MLLIRCIKLAALSVAIACAGLAGPVGAQTIELKLSHFVPPNHTFHKWALGVGRPAGEGIRRPAEVTIYPNGQLVGPPNRQFDAARNGITDMSFVLHGVTPGRYAMTELVQPGLLLAEGRLQQLDHVKANVRAGPDLPRAGARGSASSCSWRWPCPSSSIRRSRSESSTTSRASRSATPACRTEICSTALGAVPLLIAPPESQDALAKGIVEAATFPHEAALSLDLGAVAKHATEPGLATATFAFVMNPAKYNSLPADLKALIDKTTGPAAAEQFGKEWEAAEKHGRDEEIKQGVQMHTLSDADIAEIKRRAGAADRGGDRRGREDRQAGTQIPRGIHEIAESSGARAAIGWCVAPWQLRRPGLTS